MATVTRPPVELPSAEPVAWFYCDACGDPYDPQAGHACDPLGAPRGVLLGLGIALILWLLILAGLIGAGWRPW